MANICIAWISIWPSGVLLIFKLPANSIYCTVCTLDWIALETVKPNSHHHARHDKTVLSVSRPLQRCELAGNSRPSPIENLKFEHVNSNCPIHTVTPDTTQTGLFLSCLVWRCELSRPDNQTSAFCVWPVSDCVGRRIATAGRTPAQDALVWRS